MKILNKFLKLLLCIIFFVNIINVASCSDVYASDSSIQGVIDKADEFLDAGKENKKEYIDGDQLKQTTDNLYNILFTLGCGIALVIGMFLGIQFITAGIDGKAKVKEALIAYGVGCFVLFGAFGIWRLIIIIFAEVFPRAAS